MYRLLPQKIMKNTFSWGNDHNLSSFCYWLYWRIYSAQCTIPYLQIKKKASLEFSYLDMLKRLTPTQLYTKVSQLIWIYSVQSAKTLCHEDFTFTKPLGHSKGGLVLVQKFLYFDSYQRYEEAFVSSNWAHLT